MAHEPLLVERVEQEQAGGLQRLARGLEAAQVVAVARQLAEGAVEADHGVDLAAVGDRARVGLQEMDIELLVLGRGARDGQGALIGVHAEDAVAAAGELDGAPPRAAAEVEHARAGLQAHEALHTVDLGLDLGVRAPGVVLQVHAPPGQRLFLDHPPIL